MKLSVVLSVFAVVGRAQVPCEEPDCANLIHELFQRYDRVTTEDHLRVFEACRSCCWGIDSLDDLLEPDYDREVSPAHRTSGSEIECVGGPRGVGLVDTKWMHENENPTQSRQISEPVGCGCGDEEKGWVEGSVFQTVSSLLNQPFDFDFTLSNPLHYFSVANFSRNAIFHSWGFDKLSFDKPNLDVLNWENVSLDNLSSKLDYETVERLLLLSGGVSSLLSSLVTLVSWLKKRSRRSVDQDAGRSHLVKGIEESGAGQQRTSGTVGVAYKNSFHVGRHLQKLYHVATTWKSELSIHLPQVRIVRSQLGKVRGVEISIRGEPSAQSDEASMSSSTKHDESPHANLSYADTSQSEYMPWERQVGGSSRHGANESITESTGDIDESSEISSNEAEQLMRSTDTMPSIKSQIANESSDDSKDDPMYMADNAARKDSKSGPSSEENSGNHRGPIFYKSNSANELDSFILSPIDAIDEQLDTVRRHSRYEPSYADQSSSMGLFNHDLGGSISPKAPSTTSTEERTVSAVRNESMEFVDLANEQIPELIRGLRRQVKHKSQASEDRQSTSSYLGNASHVDSGFGGSNTAASRSGSRSRHLTMGALSTQKPFITSSQPRPRSDHLLSSSRSLKSVKSSASVKMSGPEDDFGWT